MSMTITEALAEIKTIGKRLEKKKQSVVANIARDSRLLDPLEGGTTEFVKRERQGVKDLESRIVAIRTAIQKSNLGTVTKVGDTSMSVAEWLTFRREVSEGQKIFLAALINGITATRQKVQRDGGRVVTQGVASAAAIVEGNKPAYEVVVHLNERELLEEQEELEKILGDLDGKLSLLNATTVIEL